MAFLTGTVKVRVRWYGAYNTSGTTFTGRTFATRFTFNEGVRPTNSYAPYDPETVTKINRLTSSNASTYIASAAIDIAHINTASIGSLSALSANMGNVTIDSSGSVKGGQTAYNTGTGFFLGYSGGAYKFSIGNPSGTHLLWDGSLLRINGIAFDPFTASVTGGDLTVSVGAGYQTYGSRTVSVSGGVAPYSYLWVGVYVGAGADSATVTAKGTGDAQTITGRLTCIVRDSNGRVTTTSFKVTATHAYGGGYPSGGTGGDG